MSVENYERKIAATRRGFCASGPFQDALRGGLAAEHLSFALIEYTSRSVKITEPVESWIHRAGERCREVGLEKIGDTLVRHAGQEAGHHLLLIEDSKILVARHNRISGTHLDAQERITRAATPAMCRYIELHESVIRGDAPFCQIAIELEIERLSLTAGRKFLAVCRNALELEDEGLSFLAEHVQIDEGHTKLNERLLARVLESAPERVDLMADTGRRALEIFGAFLDECFQPRAATLELGSRAM